MTHVSIILLACNRPNHLLRTLQSWTNIRYDGNLDFTVVDNNSKNPEVQEVALAFQEPLNLRFVAEDHWHNMNVLWNKYGQASKGDYVVFAMQDEMVCGKDILQKMIYFENNRASIFTYFLNQQTTESLGATRPFDVIDPEKIPLPPTEQTSAGLISHIHGAYRKYWDWFGWFRNDETGHLWLDQDVHLRELQTGITTQTPQGVYCLHQYHPLAVYPAGYTQPGYHYANERQARLLEPAERDLA